MSREVRVLPVLEGKAARDFYKKAAKMKESRSKEELQKGLLETMEMIKRMEQLNPRMPW